MVESDADLRRDLAAVREENAKLREIEEQFWLLLQEREDLQTQLDSLRSCSKSSSSPQFAGPSQHQHQQSGAVMSSTDSHKLREDYEKMSLALQQCMDLLLEREVAGSGGFDATPNNQQGLHHKYRGNSVADYMAWLELEQGRAEAGLSGYGGGSSPNNLMTRQQQNSSSPTGSKLSVAERATLLNEISQLRHEATQLQEELDRTDMSRLQALEDSEKLQHHVTTLSESVVELRQALNAERRRAEINEKNASAALTLRGQVADRDAEIAKLKAQLAQYQRLADVGSEELAADAARIRQEFIARSSAAP